MYWVRRLAALPITAHSGGRRSSRVAQAGYQHGFCRLRLVSVVVSHDSTSALVTLGLWSVLIIFLSIPWNHRHCMCWQPCGGGVGGGGGNDGVSGECIEGEVCKAYIYEA